jgi:N-acyl-L-homoserine lactone synthetase
MEQITFNLAQLHLHGTAFFDFLALRKRFFVDELGWDIPHDDSVEMDQYDNPQAYYSVVLRDGEVIGDARVMPTTAKWGNHTYMLRDALKGKLIDIPPSVMKADVETNEMWECTRLVMSNDVDTHADRSKCLGLIVQGLVDVAAEKGASNLMSLSPLALMRALRSLALMPNGLESHISMRVMVVVMLCCRCLQNVLCRIFLGRHTVHNHSRFTHHPSCKPHIDRPDAGASGRMIF